MGYLKAVLNNNRDKEINNLKILIITGKQLDRNVTKYEKELRKYNVKIPTSKTIKTIKTKK